MNPMCCICHDAIAPGEAASIPCHPDAMHEACLEMWRKSNHTTCPMCRREIACVCCHKLKAVIPVCKVVGDGCDDCPHNVCTDCVQDGALLRRACPGCSPPYANLDTIDRLYHRVKAFMDRAHFCPEYVELHANGILRVMEQYYVGVMIMREHPDEHWVQIETILARFMTITRLRTRLSGDSTWSRCWGALVTLHNYYLNVAHAFSPDSPQQWHRHAAIHDSGVDNARLVRVAGMLWQNDLKAASAELMAAADIIAGHWESS